MPTEPQVPVTQADRDAAADLLDELSSLLDHNGLGQVADLIRDGEYDEHDATKAFAQHGSSSRIVERERIARGAERLAAAHANACCDSALRIFAQQVHNLSPPRPAREDVEGLARELLAAEFDADHLDKAAQQIREVGDSQGWATAPDQAIRRALRAIVKALSGSPS